MIHPIRHSILLLLAFSIMLGSVGIAPGQQLCQLVKLENSDAEDKQENLCCSESETSKTEDNCCTLKVTYKKLDLIAKAQADIVKKSCFTVLAPLPQSFRFAPVTITSNLIVSYSDNSPPLTGRKLLLLKGVMLV